MLNINNYETIYELLDSNIIEIITKLEFNSDNDKFKKTKLEVLNILNKFKSEILDKEINELKNVQEWNKFVIAFYGETNAGKSTIIEALRIYFKEEKKVEEQKKFKDILENNNQKLCELENKINNNQLDISNYKQKDENLIINYELEKEKLEVKKHEIISKDIKKRETSLVYKILFFLNFINISKEINLIEDELIRNEKKFRNELQDIRNVISNKEDEILLIEKDIKDLQINSFSLLSKYRDGQIIGDGQSDFTQKTIEYNFKHNEYEFLLLDVPGIQGNEDNVKCEILSAIKKAHAIFYITAEQTLPQKGTEENPGTLEKIKEHLSSQTEIYTIFNKRINNPQEVVDKELINEADEEKSEDLDSKMKEILGDNYIGHKSISGKMGFLALADCLLNKSLILLKEDSSETKEDRKFLQQQKQIFNEQKKFLDQFSKDKLLEKALFPDLYKFITSEIVINTKKKIKKSNYNKANSLLKELICILESVSKENLEPTYNDISKDITNATNNLNNMLEKLKLNVTSIIEDNLRKFEIKTRNEIHSYIELNVDNNSFRNKFGVLLKENLEEIEDNIENEIQKLILEFQKSITEILNNMERRIESVMKDYQKVKLNSGFHLNLQINNGIDGWGVAGSLMGAGATVYWAVAAGNIWNPGGWGMATVGIIVSALTSLVSFFKSIAGAIFPSIKRSRQKNVAADSLKNIIKSIKPEIIENTEQINIATSLLINEIIEDLENVVIQIKLIDKHIRETNKNLIQFSQQIKLEGDL